MKLNGTIPDGEVIFRDTILSSGIFKIAKYKHQNTHKFQMTLSNDPNSLEFRILVIVICLLFVICDLEFLSETKTFL